MLSQASSGLSHVVTALPSFGSGFSPHIGTLADKEYMKQVPDEYLTMIIKKGGAYMGKIATMPAWEARLTDEQIRGLVAHIRTF